MPSTFSRPFKLAGHILKAVQQCLQCMLRICPKCNCGLQYLDFWHFLTIEIHGFQFSTGIHWFIGGSLCQRWTYQCWRGWFLQFLLFPQLWPTNKRATKTQQYAAILERAAKVLSWKKVKAKQLPLEHIWPQFLLFDRQSGCLQSSSSVCCSAIFLPSQCQCKSPPTAMMQSEFWIAKLAYAALKRNNLKTITETHESPWSAVGALTHAFPTCAWTADRARRRCPYHGTGSKYCRRKHMVVMWVTWYKLNKNTSDLISQNTGHEMLW